MALSETRKHKRKVTVLALARNEVDAAEAVFDDALDTYRKREMDLAAGWNRVEKAQTRLRLAREYLAEVGKRPTR